MKIDELDEWQGLTVEMLHSWLLSHGWRLAACEQGCGKELVSPSNRRCNVLRSLEDFPWSWALIETRMTAQALLREINPRWRKGFPSNAALAEHDEWLIRAPWGAEFVAHISYGGSDDGYMIMIPPDSESGDCGGIEESVWGDCFYWPCDGNANRVRWPVDAEGKML